MTFRQFLLILKARWVTALAVFTTVMLLAIAASFLLPKKYTATAALLVDVKSPDPIAGMVLPALAMPGYMATQADIITSDTVAVRVVQMLKLNENPTLKQQWQEDANGQGNFDHWIAELLQDKLTVKPSRESNVINLMFKSPDPDFSAAVANAFAKAYIEANIGLQVEPAQQYNAFFTQRQEEARKSLEGAQRRLSEYQQAHGVVASDERLDIENQKLAELQSQYVVALGQDSDASSKHASAGETLPEVLQSQVVGQLKSQIAVDEAKLQDLGGNLGRNHPQYQRAEAELSMLKQKLAEETSRVSRGVDTAGRISRSKAADLKTQMDDARSKLLELKRTHNEMAVLQQEVETAQKAFEAVSARTTESGMQSQSRQTNIAVLSSAVPPSKPSSPRLLLNLAVGLVLGLALAVAAAFGREQSDRRVRSRADLDLIPEFVILAELPAK